MNVRNLYLWGILFISICSLQSCQTEEMLVKEKGLGRKSGITTEYLKGAEAKRIANTLKTKFTNLGENGQQQSLSRTDYETIDYNNILLVVDSLGVRNYIFRVTNHPEDDYKTFHNLVMTDKNGELELTLMKYAMTDVFAQEYQERLKKFQEFKGTVTAKGLLSTNPCEDIETDFSDNEDNPEVGGGGGSYDGGIEGPSGSQGGGGTEETVCLDVSLSVVCECQRSYPDWESYLASICGNGSNPGYDVTLVVTYTNICPMGLNRCAPGGVIGVLEGNKDCNTFDKRINNILNAEGGFTFDPVDPGGATNKGISWKVWLNNAENILGVEPNLANLEMLTDDQAKAMYKTLYWDKIKCEDIADGDLRYMFFDFYVNAGSNAIITLKRTLNNLGYNLALNGSVDDDFINLINNHPNQTALYNNFKLNRINYYNNLVNESTSRYIAKYPNATNQQLLTRTLKKYQNGWLNRANKFINKTSQNSKNVNC
jgi:lysozyme family protein